MKKDSKTIALCNSNRDEWIAKNDDMFFITDHYRNYPMLLVDLQLVLTTDLKTLIKRAWELRAPKKMLQEYKNSI